eukprot:gene18490-13308_t
MSTAPASADVEAGDVNIVITNQSHTSPAQAQAPASPHAPAPQAHEIHARRSGSASVLLRNEKGELVVERKNSDIRIALKSRMSASSLPNILPLPEAPVVAPVIDATDVLERTGGTSSTGAYKEHLYTVEVLAEKFSTHIDLKDPSKSKGLASEKAADLMKEYGPNVLTPPPRLPLWMLFLLQFTNLLMVLLQVTALLCIILFIVNPTVWDNLYL